MKTLLTPNGLNLELAEELELDIYDLLELEKSLS